MSDVSSVLSPETPPAPAGPPEQPQAKRPAWYKTRIARAVLLAGAVFAAAGLTVFVCFYVKFARLTEQNCGPECSRER
jgi:hypothetical protein